MRKSASYNDQQFYLSRGIQIERKSMLRAAYFLVATLALSSTTVQAEGKRPMAVEDLFRFKRIADPQISPDGKQVVYALTTVDLTGNKTTTNLWLASPSTGETRQLTTTSKHDRHPRWSPDSHSILFESDRSGENQLWLISLQGGE